MSGQDAPDLQGGQDPDEAETRRDEEGGGEAAPLAQTELEQEDEHDTSPGD
jgi:hypothetical protein